MKAYYNGITLEGTPEEVAQCMKAIQEQGIPASNTLRKAIDNIYEYADRSVTSAKLSGPVLTEDKIGYGELKLSTGELTTAGKTAPGMIIKMTEEQFRAYMDARENNPD